MKKKILITMPSMFLGGAERSLIGLLQALDYDSYDVDLFLYRKEGELLGDIPSKVNILDEIKEYTTFDRPIKDLLCSHLWKYGINRVLAKFALQRYSKRNSQKQDVWSAMQYISHYLMPLLPEIPGEYDAGINFLGIHEVLCKKVHAKIKIGWIHTDYSRLIPVSKMDREVYSQLDYIVTVSDECKRIFDQHYPEYENKSIVIENILSKKYISKLAEEKVVFPEVNEGDIVLCSVGRFSDAKNFDNVPVICSEILSQGYPVKWFLIGYGADEALISNKIEEYGMQEHVINLGKKENPYPYIKNCDIYVQPSRYEGKAVTVREAQILEKPVIITNFQTSKNQLEDGQDGIIVPMDNRKCANGIVEIIKDKQKQLELSEKCGRRDYTNQEEIYKLYDLFGGR